MSNVVTNLFVYGTLMPSHFRFPLIEKHVHSTHPATIPGILVDLGAFPALLPGQGIVQGILLKVDPAMLQITDRIEGYYPEHDHCLYLRKSVTATLQDSSQVSTWTYEYARAESIMHRPRCLVGNADGAPLYAWRQHIKPQEAGEE